ncbi:SRF [Ecytonucleospora hepatopenaei]|uniref:SRF n=1 Tax=Ecytonucleospora hepatopenaei TaxID=646526 RepID=A0A1W0E4Y9_9MICR|nr:SRF [Ecytonucleospora hepatopenaei]
MSVKRKNLNKKHKKTKNNINSEETQSDSTNTLFYNVKEDSTFEQNKLFKTKNNINGLFDDKTENMIFIDNSQNLIPLDENCNLSEQETTNSLSTHDFEEIPDKITRNSNKNQNIGFKEINNKKWLDEEKSEIFSEAVLSPKTNLNTKNQNKKIKTSFKDSAIMHKNTNGKQKIKLEYITQKTKRSVTFSKRKKGLLKKAYELALLTNAEISIIIANENGHVYTYTTKKFKKMLKNQENIIRKCLENDADTEDNLSTRFFPDSFE